MVRLESVGSISQCLFIKAFNNPHSTLKDAGTDSSGCGLALQLKGGDTVIVACLVVCPHCLDWDTQINLTGLTFL